MCALELISEVEPFARINQWGNRRNNFLHVSGMDTGPFAYKIGPMEDTNISGDRPITVREEPIELCQFLKFAGATGTGGEAKVVISQGLVTLNGAVETRKRRKLMAGDRVEFDGHRLVVRVG